MSVAIATRVKRPGPLVSNPRAWSSPSLDEARGEAMRRRSSFGDRRDGREQPSGDDIEGLLALSRKGLDLEPRSW